MKFKYAFAGLKQAFKEKAIMIQIILAVCAIIGGIIIKLDAYEWLAFTICIGLVISLEIFNSVIEKLCDLYSLEKNEKIRVIKDMAASAVLVSAIAAFIVALICVLRRI